MIPTDRVVQRGQWLTTVEMDNEPHTPWVRITLASFPGTLAFKLSSDDASALAERLLALTKHQITEGTVGPLFIRETDYHTPPRMRVLQLQLTGVFPGECTIFLTDIVIKRLAFDLAQAVQHIKMLSSEPGGSD